LNLVEFIKKFAEQFDETDVETFKPNTKFKALADWTSMTALLIIAMINDEYDVIIKGDDIRNSETIEDLFNVVSGIKSKA